MPNHRSSPFIRLHESRHPLLGCGGLFFLVLVHLLVSSTLACSPPNLGSAKASAPSSTVTIGVAEGGDAAASEVGFPQIWPLVTFEGLINNLGRDGRPRPAIAESWRVSPDGLTWRLILRANVYFHDGTRCDAKAVKTILDAAIHRPEIALYPGLLDISSLQTEGDRTLVISLRRPSAFLLDDLYVEITKQSLEGEKVGTGPYKAVRQSKNQVTLQAHAHYSQGTPQIQNLVFKSYPTLRQAWSSLLRGEIEGVWNLSSEGLEFLTNQAVETFSFPRNFAYVMAFNSQRPQLRSPAVRRALNAAVDRNTIIRSVLNGRGRPAYTPIWPDHWAYDTSVTGYSFDPSLARTTLQAVGMHRNDSPQKGQPLQRLRFSCIVPSDRTIFERLALVLQKQLYDVGVDLELESIPLSQVDARLRSRQFDAALFDVGSGPSLSRVYLFWRSSGEYSGLNVFGYHNPSADKWLDLMRFAQDEATTRAATSQLQRVMIDDPPGLFIAWSEQTRAVSRRINVGTATDQDPFEQLWKWHFVDNQGLAQK